MNVETEEVDTPQAQPIWSFGLVEFHNKLISDGVSVYVFDNQRNPLKTEDENMRKSVIDAQSNLRLLCEQEVPSDELGYNNFKTKLNKSKKKSNLCDILLLLSKVFLFWKVFCMNLF
jgi:hypothetical protein